MRPIRRVSHTHKFYHNGDHRFEHWYVDNQVYFITSRTRHGVLAFKEETARSIFWDRFNFYTKEYGFVPWVTTLIGNHYHTLGYLKTGRNLGQMMRKLHGSVAKLVNDTLPERLTPFWREGGGRDYFDGCIRSEKQCRLAYRYTLTQSVRHRICSDWKQYADTKVSIELERGVKRALELKAFLVGVLYARYERKKKDVRH